MTPRTYASPEAFKQALEQRLRTPAKSGADFARKRQFLVFDRFLARVVDVFGGAVTLKGGLVLELRLARARTTKDVDLRMVGAPDEVLANLQEAGRRQLGDFMLFEVGPDDDHPKIQNDGMQYEGHRFRAVCKLAGKIYGQPFGVDVAFGDPIFGEPEIIVAEDVLAFAGIAPPTVRVYPIETHIAEKLHAYTMPRERPNSRVKDLPDLALLATARHLDAKVVRAAVEQTFAQRCSLRRLEPWAALRSPNWVRSSPRTRSCAGTAGSSPPSTMARGVATRGGPEPSLRSRTSSSAWRGTTRSGATRASAVHCTTSATISPATP